MTLLKKLTDAVQGKAPLSSTRSTHWPAVRKAHLALHPTCALCGGTEKLEVHHIQVFHVHPELELDPTNFITLCESGKGGINCHLAAGHLGNFKSFNTSVVHDAEFWRKRIAERPKVEE